MDITQEVTVELKAHAAPLISRAFKILRDRIQQRCPARVVEAGAGAPIILDIDDGLPPDAFRIDQVGAAVRVAGGTPRGLLYGVGKFLRTSRYDGAFRPSPWSTTPDGWITSSPIRTRTFHAIPWMSACPATCPCSTSRRSACGATGHGAALALTRCLAGSSACGTRSSMWWKAVSLHRVCPPLRRAISRRGEL